MKRLRDTARRAALRVSAPALVHIDRRFADLTAQVRGLSKTLDHDVARTDQIDQIADALRNVERLLESGDATRTETVAHQMTRLAALRADIARIAAALGDDSAPSRIPASVRAPAEPIGRMDGGMQDLSPRVQAALDSKASSANDFFGGWDEADLLLLQRWAQHPKELVPVDGALVDWLGGRTNVENHQCLSIYGGEPVVIAELPVPDDRVHAETIEYVALLTSLERARAHGNSYTMFELGSSFAPWSVSAGMLAHRAGFATIDLCAVEASAATVPRIHEHIELNGLRHLAGLTFRVVNAAVSTDPGTLYFPKVDTRFDNGAQVVSHPSVADYRGLEVAYDEVEAVTFDSLSAGCPRVDFLHLDLQGAEESLLLDDRFVAAITERVSALLLATQSRFIEGLALRALPDRGWYLVRERPTTFVQNSRTSDVNGWTVRDGAQLWLNHRFDVEHAVHDSELTAQRPTVDEGSTAE